MRAANKAPRTIETYMRAADQFVANLRAHGMPLRADLVRCEHVEDRHPVRVAGITTKLGA